MERQEPTYAATVAHRLTSLLLILSIVFGGYLAFETAGGGDRTVVLDATATLDQKLLPKGVYPTSEQRTGIAIEDPATREQRLAAAAELLPMLPWLAILGLLWRITRSVRDGDPFVTANVRRLRAIGLLLIVGAAAIHFAVDGLRETLLDPYLRPASDVDAPGLRPPDGDFPDMALLAGLGVIVLAQVFDHGVALREDAEATI